MLARADMTLDDLEQEVAEGRQGAEGRLRQAELAKAQLQERRDRRIAQTERGKQVRRGTVRLLGTALVIPATAEVEPERGDGKKEDEKAGLSKEAIEQIAIRVAWKFEEDRGVDYLKSVEADNIGFDLLSSEGNRAALHRGEGAGGRRHGLPFLVSPRPHAVPGDPDHARDPGRPALAAGRGPGCGMPGDPGAGADPGRAGRAGRARRAVPDRPDQHDRAAAGRDRGRAVGRGGPGTAHRGRLPAVRSLFAQRSLAQTALGRQRLRRGGQLASRTAGRWSLLPAPMADCDPDELAEAVAEQLAVRWGVVFRDLLARENIAVPWREVLWAFRRMEARGTVAGGRFVNGFSGEQFAHPDAVAMLREIRKRPRDEETVVLSAADWPAGRLAPTWPPTRSSPPTPGSGPPCRAWEEGPGAAASTMWRRSWQS